MSTNTSNKTSSIKRVLAPKFSWRFLLPNYWHIWLGVLILFLLICLPYPVIKRLGSLFGRTLKFIAPERVSIAKKNIHLCFPDWSEERINAVFKANVDRTGMALFETAMGWWWPSWRIKKHCKVEGFDQVLAALEQGNGVFGLAIHNVNLELACRTIGYTYKSVGFYRKHNNPLMDYLQYYGRNRSNKYMVDKRNAKAFIQAMNNGELGLYLPDQDYGAKQSIFVPFGGVEKTATTTATLMFAKRTKAVPFLLTPQSTGNGCSVKFVSAIDYLADNDQEHALTQLNRDILALILEQPESYLWMHKRFKTRPVDAKESFY